MAYRSTAEHIQKSCYNCSYFDLGDNMIDGECQLTPVETHTDRRKISGLGTCDDFTPKDKSKKDWRRRS